MNVKLLIIPGFRSSPTLKKYSCLPFEKIPVYIDYKTERYDAIKLKLEDIIWNERQEGTNLIFVAHSLGSYWAELLSDKHGIPAIIANPSLFPYELELDIIDQRFYLNDTTQKELIHYYVEDEDEYTDYIKHLDYLQAKSDDVHIEQYGTHSIGNLEAWKEFVVSRVNRHQKGYYDAS